MRKIILFIFLLFITLFFFFDTRVSANQEFPSCESMWENGDHAHFDSGLHQVYNGELLLGSDDVYTLESGNYLQCFCPEVGAGTQTNWERSENGNVNGQQWNLGDYQYNAENKSYTCNENEVTPTATASATPVFSGQGDGLSDGRSDGKSDGRSSSPQVPLGPPATGRGGK